MEFSALVVDDDQSSRDLIEYLLKDTEACVIKVKNGEDAIAAFDFYEFDLLITDIFMPDKDGIEVLKETRARFPDVKVVVVSGGGEKQNMSYLSMAEEMGTDVVLEKTELEEKLADSVAGLFPDL